MGSSLSDFDDSYVSNCNNLNAKHKIVKNRNTARPRQRTGEKCRILCRPGPVKIFKYLMKNGEVIQINTN